MKCSAPVEAGGNRLGAMTLPCWLTVAAMLFGGCAIFSSPPDPMSNAVVEARAEQTQLMKDALSEVADELDGEVIGQSSVDQCYEGQRNWKVDTGYDHRCSLLIGVLIGLDGDFRAQMLDLDSSLRELGWESDNGEWPGGLVDDYWDLRSGENLDGHVRLDRLPGPYGVRRDDLRLLFDYGSPTDERGLERIDRRQKVTLWCCGLPLYEDKDLLDVSQAVGAAPRDHLILITVEGHYFES